MSYNSRPLTEPVAILTAVATLFFIYRKFSSAGRHLPPGPRPLPIVGNLFDLPKSEQWLTYDKWAKRYNSDVLYLSVLGTDMIIVNSAKAATALLERKSGLYSDRPSMPMINGLIGLAWHFGFMPYGDKWRNTRKVFSASLNPTATTRFKPQIEKWNKIFLENIRTSPERLMEHLQHMASGISLEAAFGMQVQPSGQPDPFIGAAKQAVEAMMHAGIFGSYLVDFLPFLKYVPAPLAKFRQQAKSWRVSCDIAGTVPFSLAKKAVSEDKAESSVASTLLLSSEPVDEGTMADATHAMFASGSAATVSALGTFFLAMTLYPEVQKKAQAELDQVFSKDHQLLDFSDEESLPYIGAIIKEVTRWNPVVPLAFPHRLTTDDMYEGYHLPAGSVVVPNAWAILHDEDIYGPDTLKFKPERFLTQDGKLNHAVQDPSAAFGFARRACPGKHFAHLSLFITMATTLATFDIQKATDASGKLVTPTAEYTDGMLRYPLPFDCNITPRSKAVH